MRQVLGSMGPIIGRQSDMIFALDCMAGRFGLPFPNKQMT